jgi:hypothetical protein
MVMTKVMTMIPVTIPRSAMSNKAGWETAFYR